MAMANFSPSLTDFINKLLEEKGFKDADEDVMEELRADLAERVQNRVNLSLVKSLPVEKLEEANELMDSADDEAMQAFFAKHIPNLDQVIAGELIAFRSTYLGSAAQ